MAEKTCGPNLVRCLYCGRDIPDDHPACMHCGAPSHFQQRNRRDVRRRFLIFFVILTVAVLAIAFIAPR